MAKFIFLICILVALVLSPHAEAKSSELEDCERNLELPAVLKDRNISLSRPWEALICDLESLSLLNDDKTVNYVNFEQFVLTRWRLPAPYELGNPDTFLNCGTSASAAAEANATKVDVYGAWLKCIHLTRVNYPISDWEDSFVVE